MKIGIHTWGVEGDIRPYLALAGGLSEAGHDVTVAYTSVDNTDYTPLAKALHCQSIPVYQKFPPDFEEWLWTLIQNRQVLKQIVSLLKRLYEPAIEAMYEASLALCRDNDMVIGHVIDHTLVAAAEKLACPRATVVLCPTTLISKYIPPLGIPNFGTWINSLLWKMSDRTVMTHCFPSANHLRTRVGLPPITSYYQEVATSKMLTMVAVSSVLCVRQPDWGDHIQMCGFFDMAPNTAEQWDMPEALRAFLDAGEPPIYFTFGSFTGLRCEETTQLGIDAAEFSGTRAIIYSDWENLAHIPNTAHIYRIGRVPYQDIFPYCSAIVHHGGAGTSHSALRSGCPSVLIKHAIDHEYWAPQLQRIGVSGKPLHRRTVTARKLADQIRTVLDTPSMKEQAQQCAETIRQEHGVQRAVALIEDRFS